MTIYFNGDFVQLKDELNEIYSRYFDGEKPFFIGMDFPEYYYYSMKLIRHMDLYIT